MSRDKPTAGEQQDSEVPTARTLHCNGCQRDIRVDAFSDGGRFYRCACPDVDPKPVEMTVILPRDWEFRGDESSTADVEREASSTQFSRWMGQAAENIDEWGLQDEETLLLAIQEEVGELTQAHLEARSEGGDPARIDEELDDLGALLIQLHEQRQEGRR